MDETVNIHSGVVVTLENEVESVLVGVAGNLNGLMRKVFVLVATLEEDFVGQRFATVRSPKEQFVRNVFVECFN